MKNVAIPARGVLALYNLTAALVAYPLTTLSLALSGFRYVPGYSDGLVSSPFEISFFVIVIVTPLGVLVSILMSQWKRSFGWAAIGMLFALAPIFLSLVVVALQAIAYLFR